MGIQPFWVRHNAEISSKLGQKSTFVAKMPVTQAADEIFWVRKGQKPSDVDGPFTGHQSNWPGAKIWSRNLPLIESKCAKIRQNAKI